MPLSAIPARYSLLSASALGTLVQALWSLEAPVQCHLLQPAQSGGNDLYIITSGPRHFILRVYIYNGETFDALEARAQIMDTLVQEHIPVDQPLALPQGPFTAAIQAPEGLRYLQLFTFAPGTPPGWQMTEKQALLYGQTLAHMHDIIDHLPHLVALPVLDEEILLYAPIQVLLSFLALDSPQAQELKNLEVLLQKRLAPLPRTLPTYGFCHADCHKTNVLFTQDGQITLIDFDCAGYSWRAYELSVLLWSLSRITDVGTIEYEQGLWDAYMKGYQQVRVLDAQTLEAIPCFVLIRHLWWMAIDLRKIQQDLVGRAWLNTSWFDQHISRLYQWMRLTGCM